MNFKHVIGLDMAKESFTLHVHQMGFKNECENTPKHIREMLKTLARVLKCSLNQCLFCLEHTGLYSLEIMLEFSAQDLSFSVISGLELKRSLGLTRGKSDPIDAARIAEYAFLRQHKLKLFKFPSKALTELQHLLSLRAMFVRNRASYQQRMNEQFQVLKKTHYPIIFQTQKRTIDNLAKQILKIEKRIQEVIENDVELEKYHTLLQTVKGVGPVLSAHMIVKTQCFQAFSDWRKFACFCGTAPFPHESGKIKYNRRISKIGDAGLKTLLTLCARTAMLHDAETRLFSQRKKEQGKTNKCITNAVRNKLLARMFSVAKRGTPYVPLFNFAS